MAFVSGAFASGGVKSFGFGRGGSASSIANRLADSMGATVG
jgi:hypothetical protein